MADIASRRRQLGGDDTRGSQLSVTLGQLRGQLTRQQSQLSRSVERTEAYEHEVTTLGEMIATAQRRLVAVAPPGDATAESLRLQLLEHKVSGGCAPPHRVTSLYRATSGNEPISAAIFRTNLYRF